MCIVLPGGFYKYFLNCKDEESMQSIVVWVSMQFFNNNKKNEFSFTFVIFWVKVLDLFSWAWIWYETEEDHEL